MEMFTLISFKRGLRIKCFYSEWSIVPIWHYRPTYKIFQEISTTNPNKKTLQKDTLIPC